MVKDPVCGMMVDPERAAAKSEYKGKTYYFCARGCKVAFDKDPEKYVTGGQDHAMPHWLSPKRSSAPISPPMSSWAHPNDRTRAKRGDRRCTVVDARGR